MVIFQFTHNTAEEIVIWWELDDLSRSPDFHDIHEWNVLGQQSSELVNQATATNGFEKSTSNVSSFDE